MIDSCEHIEYDRDVNPYPSVGKKYNGEKAIISLTSWKARIETVSKTLFSLIKMCPGFHIVLVLSEEEFPKREKELPKSLMLFVKNNLIEILWVYKNYKAFKKVLFTMDKYRDVPIISADDGCVYIENFAEKLYKEWLNKKDNIVSIMQFKHEVNNNTISYGGGGYGILYPPNCKLKNHIYLLDNQILNTNHDDALYGVLSYFLHIKWSFLNSKKTFIGIKNDENVGLYRNKKFSPKDLYTIYDFINDHLIRSNSF